MAGPVRASARSPGRGLTWRGLQTEVRANRTRAPDAKRRKYIHSWLAVTKGLKLPHHHVRIFERHRAVPIILNAKPTATSRSL